LDDDFDDLDAEIFLSALSGRNPKQRRIIDGLIATMQAIGDDEIAARWLKRSRRQILDELNEAGRWP